MLYCNLDDSITFPATNRSKLLNKDFIGFENQFYDLFYKDHPLCG
jgi:hypothetical protein